MATQNLTMFLAVLLVGQSMYLSLYPDKLCVGPSGRTGQGGT